MGRKRRADGNKNGKHKKDVADNIITDEKRTKRMQVPAKIMKQIYKFPGRLHKLEDGSITYKVICNVTNEVCPFLGMKNKSCYNCNLFYIYQKGNETIGG